MNTQRSLLEGVKKSLCRITLFIVFIPFAVLGQEGALQFFVDHAQFRLQKNYVYLEVYYSVKRDNLTFVKEGDKYVARMNIKTFIFKGDSLVVGDDISVEDFVTSVQEVSSRQKLVELSAFQIREGDYRLRVVLTDLNSQKSAWYSDNLHVTPYSREDLSISQVQLASSIYRVDKSETKFDKNWFRVIPNPSRIYGTGLPTLYFYAEAYNLAYGGEATGSAFRVHCTVTDTSGKLAVDLKEKRHIKPGSSIVIQNKMNINSLSSGMYTLKVELIDDFTGKMATVDKRFFIYNVKELIALRKKEGVTAAISVVSEYDQMDEKEINKAFEKLRYISTRDERKIFKKLDLEGKRNFMVKFWQRRDPTPNTPSNEYKREYLDLLRYANENFSVGQKEGWKTDRGRVLLLYGKPDQIDRFPSSSDINAYQIWYYYQIEGGVQFVFVDRTDVGDYELVHSTKRDELRDDDWQRYLYK